MANERVFRKQVVASLKELGAFSVENAVGAPGVPDVAYAGGWLELKDVDSWPARADSPVVIPHWTPQQRVWHLKWARAGGASWVFIKCLDSYLLLRGLNAAQGLGFSTFSQLVATPCAQLWGRDWQGRLPCSLKT